MIKPIAVLLAVLAAAAPVVAQEGTLIRFNKKYGDLPVEYREPIRLAYIYNRRYQSYFDTEIEEPYSIALVDLNNDGVQEVVIRFDDDFNGMEMDGTILIARKTDAGWRFIGYLYAPEFSQHPSVPLHLTYHSQLYAEDKTVGGWRVINDGPTWEYKHHYKLTDPMGGHRYCWASRPNSPYQHGKHTRMGLPFDSGGPGYFNRIEATKPCPEN